MLRRNWPLQLEIRHYSIFYLIVQMRTFLLSVEIFRQWMSWFIQELTCSSMPKYRFFKGALALRRISLFQPKYKGPQTFKAIYLINCWFSWSSSWIRHQKWKDKNYLALLHWIWWWYNGIINDGIVAKWQNGQLV